jgi:hypothetical protein
MKKTPEYAAEVLNSIKADLNSDVIKDYEMPKLCNMKTCKETGFAVILTLSTKYDYTSDILDEWKKKLNISKLKKHVLIIDEKLLKTINELLFVCYDEDGLI